jgi:hypothetical protein
MTLAPGKMYMPTDIAFGGAGIVFVVEQFNHRISKWTYTQPSYTFTLDATWGSNGDGTSGEGAPIGDGGVTDNGFYRPTGIAFDATNSRLYVTDTFHHRVRVLNSATGAFIESFGIGGTDLNSFYRPAGIAINAGTDTVLVIADEFNNRAVSYDVNAGSPNNPTVLADPSATTGLSFIRPHGVVFDVTPSEFNVTDSQRSVISSYNVAGVFQDQYGTPGTTPGNVNLFYPGSGDGVLGGTATTAFADTRNNIIKAMTNGALSLTSGTSPGTGDGNLYWPESVTAFADTVNYALVANTRNNRIETYSSSAVTLTAETPFNFGSP